MHPSPGPNKTEQTTQAQAATGVHDVPVRGGRLRVYQVGDGPRFVLGLHGLSDNHLSVQHLAQYLEPGYTFLAPDLRGRGDSSELRGPFNLDAHASDCARILEHLGISTVALVGHSMGALIAERLALTVPEKIIGIVLVDGGIVPLAKFPDIHVWMQALTLRWMIKSRVLNPERLIGRLVGPILENLNRTFPTADEYMDVWHNHPAFHRHWDDTLQRRFAYDLVGEERKFHSRISAEAVRDDFLDALTDIARIGVDLSRIECPMHLVQATRGMLDEPKPLIRKKDVASWVRKIPWLHSSIIADTSHTSILLEDRALRQIATIIQSMF